MHITDHYIHAFTDTDPPMPIWVPLAAVRVLQPVTMHRSPALHTAGWLELLYVGLPARPCRALVRLDSVATALGWNQIRHSTPTVAHAFHLKPARAGEPIIYGATDTDPPEPLTIRLADIRGLHHIGARSDALHTAGWLEVIVADRLPWVYRALVDVDQLACGLGWYAGFDRNLTIAEAFAHVAFYPERKPAVTASTFARAGFIARVRAMAAVH